jgi:hypothetical protein
METKPKYYDISKLDNSEVFAISLLFISFFAILVSVLQPIVLISLFVIVISFIFLIRTKIKKAKKFGIINFFPENLKYTLLKRSILDLLMDFWHLPILGKYFKVLICPFLYGYSPDQSLQEIQSLDEDVQAKLKTKGILNLFGENVKTLMLPENNSTDDAVLIKKDSNKNFEEKVKLEKSSESTNCVSAKTQQNIKLKIKETVANPIPEIDEPSDERLLTREAMCKYDKESKNSAISNISKFDNRIINELPYKSEMLFYDNVNNEVEFKICNVKKEKKNLNYYQPNEFLLVKLPSVKEEDNKVYYYIDDDDCNNTTSTKDNKKVYKSIVISSTKKMKEKEQNMTKPYIWDNYKKYFQINSKNGRLAEGKHMLELVKNYILKAIFSRISKQSIAKGTFVILSTVLVQIILSRKIRTFSKSYITMLISTLISSSISYLVVSKISSIASSESSNVKEKKMNQKLVK